MSTLEVIEAGPYTGVQDRGRFGGQRYGLGPAGAMDLLALAQANVLVGQPVGAAAIEIGPLPAKFKAKGGSIRFALTGAQRGATLAGRDINPGETVLMAEGETLVLRATRQGVFSTLAFEGSIVATPVFGSLSVHARAGIGSPYSRALQAGDTLEVGDAGAWEAENILPPLVLPQGPIRVVPGPQDDHFTAEAVVAFYAAEWMVSATSDRMGYRLDGPLLAHAPERTNIISDGIAAGSVQIPGSGLPLVLLADRGTTGGYPKIATIITADLGRMAQTPAGSRVRFAAVTIAGAQTEARRIAALVAGLPRAIRTIGGGDLSPEFLLSANLAGAATDAFADDGEN